MKFAAHYLPTYIPELDGPVPEFYRRMFEQMQLLEAVGFDQVWVTEHHFHEYGGTVPDPATFLAAVAGRTSTIRLGIAIVVMPFHNPLRVAESYAMVDVISGGRLNFGLGRGTVTELQHLGIGYEESTAKLREGFEILRQAWSQEAVDFRGEVYQYEGVRILPRPIQEPHPPFWIAASRSDDTYRWAGSNGAHLLTLPSLNDTEPLRVNIGNYRESLQKAGHDPSTREVLGKFHIYVSDSYQSAVKEAAPFLQNYWRVSEEQNSGLVNPPRRVDAEDEIAKGRVIAGDPQRVIDTIHRWREALGLTVMSGTVFFGGLPQELALKNIRMFGEKVIPAFSSVPA